MTHCGAGMLIVAQVCRPMAPRRADEPRAMVTLSLWTAGARTASGGDDWRAKCGVFIVEMQSHTVVRELQRVPRSGKKRMLKQVFHSHPKIFRILFSLWK